MAKKNTPVITHVCGQCANVREVTKFNTLTVKEGKPTLGECPFVTNRKVLLSEIACGRFRIKI